MLTTLKVKGYLNLSKTPDEIPRNLFYVGQVLTVRVDFIDDVNQKLTVSLPSKSSSKNFIGQ